MRLRAVWQLAFGWVFTLLYSLLVVIVSLLTVRRLSARLTPLFCRCWGRVMLRAFGVRMTVEGLEHLSGRRKRIATFNHSSLLDAFVVTALMPEGGVAAVKREVLWYPIVGLAGWSLGFLFIDRGHSNKARATLARAVRRLERERLTVLIAPEGTRARSDQLGPFKRGAIHLSRSCRTPVVPIVIEGARRLQPRGQLFSLPGTLHVRVLPPIPWEQVNEGTPAEASERLRALYLRELGAMQQPRPANPLPPTRPDPPRAPLPL